MTIKQKFILFFTTFIISITSILGLVAYNFLKSEVELFVNAPNKEFVAIMADELLLKSAVSFIALLILISALSIFIGLLLFENLSNSFLINVEKITGLASDRIEDRGSKTEIELLEKYIEIAIDDEKRLKDLEKVNSWKDGARLLIHEVKNPLTPLKLSLENILIKDIEQIEDDLIPAIASARDIENILNNFKDLVNIHFEQLLPFDFINFLDELKSQLKMTYPDLEIDTHFTRDKITVYSESNLLKILIINLINNAMEANVNGIIVRFTEIENRIDLSFKTLNSHIDNIDRCFVLGYSGKGKGRGYGLFLCKMISNYLGIDLSAENTNNDVVFKVTILKEKL